MGNVEIQEKRLQTSCDFSKEVLKFAEKDSNYGWDMLTFITLSTHVMKCF